MMAEHLMAMDETMGKDQYPGLSSRLLPGAPYWRMAGEMPFVIDRWCSSSNPCGRHRRR